jgi:hypothetical protein
MIILLFIFYPLDSSFSVALPNLLIPFYDKQMQNSKCFAFFIFRCTAESSRKHGSVQARSMLPLDSSSAYR